MLACRQRLPRSPSTKHALQQPQQSQQSRSWNFHLIFDFILDLTCCVFAEVRWQTDVARALTTAGRGAAFLPLRAARH